jgi:hypothetical protein
MEFVVTRLARARGGSVGTIHVHGIRAPYNLDPPRSEETLA